MNKLNIDIQLFIEGIMMHRFSKVNIMSITNKKQLFCSNINEPSNPLLDKRNSIDEFNIQLLVKSFNDDYGDPP